MAEHPFQRKPTPPRPTGRTLVVFQPKADIAIAKSSIARTTGMQTLDARDFTSTTAMGDALRSGNAVVLPRFGVAVVPKADSSQTQALQAVDGVRRVRPEFYMYAINEPVGRELTGRYNKWVREGLTLLTDTVTSAASSARVMMSDFAVATSVPFVDTDQLTWGLAAVGADVSGFTGRGIRVAVLDTGLDSDHPDFKGREIVGRGFANGNATDFQDVQGHGTHTAGTIAGPQASKIGRRYGVAPDVELHVGKVLGDNGSGAEGDILNGINWAIDQKCVVISMSLGRPTFEGEQPDPLYEEVGNAALAEGCLIIAAAGNESARDFGFIAPVGAPANSPSILAVAAVDPSLKVGTFSCGAINANGGEINVAGPGVSVYSSFPRPRLSRVLDGTSMACPHAAGIAALWAESDPSLRGQKLWDALVKSAREIGPARDVGAGLVRAPGTGIGV
jgi:subtilisin